MRKISSLIAGLLLLCGGAVGNASSEAAMGFDRNGSLHIGLAEKNDGIYRMSQSARVELFAFTNHWCLQTQNRGTTWHMKKPTRKDNGKGKFTLNGVLAKMPYSETVALSGNTITINTSLNKISGKSPYKTVDATGLALSFGKDDGYTIKVDGRKRTLDKVKGRYRKVNNSVEIVFKSGLSFVVDKLNGLASCSIILFRERLYVLLKNTQGKPFSCSIRANAAKVEFLAAKNFERTHEHKGWFSVQANPEIHFVNVASEVLNAPAGKHGFLTVKNGEFYFQNSPERVKFYGMTLVHDAKFPTKKAAERLAGQISKLGCNLVRLHHIDHSSAGRGIWDRKELKNKTRNFDKELMDRMDYLIFQFKKHGVYVHLDGLTLRRFKPGDNIREYNKLSNGLKGTAYLYEAKELLEKQKEFLSDLWNHYNPYTKLKYKDDPVFATTEIVNESDLYTHGSLKHHFPPFYADIFKKVFKQWLADNKLKTCDWKHVDADVRDRFKCEMMRDYYRIMYNHLRQVGVNIPICGTNWLAGPLALDKANEEMDFIADHPYWHHSSYKDNPLLPGSRAGELSAGKLVGKPFVHNEWNSAKGRPDRAAVWLYQTALMAAADHDGSYLFALSHSRWGKYSAKDVITLNYGNDPGIIALFPAAAILFNRNDFKMPEKEFVFPLNATQLFGSSDGSGQVELKNMKETLPQYGAAAFYGRAALDVSKVKLFKSEIPFKATFPAAGKVPRATKSSLPSISTYPAANFSGELVQYWKDGYFLVKTPKSKWAAGYFGGKGEIDLGDGVAVTVGNVDYACVTITSLDNKPVDKSAHLMIVAVSYVETPGMYYDTNWGNPGGVVSSDKIICQPVHVGLKLPATKTKAELTGKNATGTKAFNKTIKKVNGKFNVELDKKILVYELKN